MAKRYHLNVVIDASLERELRRLAEKRGVTVSAIVRLVLGEAIKPNENPLQAGWLEGINSGEAAARRVIGEHLARAVDELRTSSAEGT